jgi:hypothetical protein
VKRGGVDHEEFGKSVDQSFFIYEILQHAWRGENLLSFQFGPETALPEVLYPGVIRARLRPALVDIAPLRGKMGTGVLEGQDYRVFLEPFHIEPPGLVKIDYQAGRAAVEYRMGVNEQFFATLLAGDA